MDLLHLLRRFREEESGQDLIEYALIGALVAVSSVAAMSGLASKIASEYNNIGSQLT